MLVSLTEKTIQFFLASVLVGTTEHAAGPGLRRIKQQPILLVYFNLFNLMSQYFITSQDVLIILDACWISVFLPDKNAQVSVQSGYFSLFMD